MSRRGLLLTITEPPPYMEEEFNAWYDTEHLPERLSIPGFLSARRWVADCKPGEGKYLATYELESPAVLVSPAYLGFFEKPTPWTKRCLDNTVVFKRWACEQVSPGNAEPHARAKAVVPVFGDSTHSIPAALQVRSFLAAAGEPRRVAIYELADASVVLPSTFLPGSFHVYRAYA
jgi:hypothetical protein